MFKKSFKIEVHCYQRRRGQQLDSVYLAHYENLKPKPNIGTGSTKVHDPVPIGTGRHGGPHPVPIGMYSYIQGRGPPWRGDQLVTAAAACSIDKWTERSIESTGAEKTMCRTVEQLQSSTGLPDTRAVDYSPAIYIRTN